MSDQSSQCSDTNDSLSSNEILLSDNHDSEVETSVMQRTKKRLADDDTDKPMKKSKVEADDNSSLTCFIGNLSWDVSEEQLKEQFEEWLGQDSVESVRIITDRMTGKKKGFGYVEFTSSEYSTKALTFTGNEIDGREIRIDLSTPRAPKELDNRRAEAPTSSATDTLFVANLSFQSTEDELRDTLNSLFGEHGSVKNVRLPSDRDTGKLKGFGYIQFDTAVESKAALDALNGQEFQGRNLRIDFAGEKGTQVANPRGRGGRGGFRGFRGSDRGGRGGRGGFRGRGGSDRGGGRGRGGSRGRGRF